MKRFLLAAVLLLAACTQPAGPERVSFFALGTLVEVSVAEPPAHAAEALAELEALLLAEERRWQAFGEGELARLNERLAAGETVAVPAELREGILLAAELSRRSQGLFNPAIGRLVMLWGFHDSEAMVTSPPAAAEIDALLPPPGMDALVFGADGMQSRDPRLWLDMGAFAKGLALRKAAALLQERGLGNAIINASGDMVILGRARDRDWRIGIRHPREPGVFAALTSAGNESVFTSGDYERFFEYEGRRFHHLLDPRTGHPADNAASVTVITEDAALADAASTALFVAGRGRWAEVARDLGVRFVMLATANGAVEMTPEMAERVEFLGEPPPVTVVTP